MDYYTESASCVYSISLLDFIKKIFICVPKLNKSLTGLEWCEGE